VTNTDNVAETGQQQARGKRKYNLPRGLFQKRPGSKVYYIRYVDSEGNLRREKASSKSDAIDLYRKRKSDALRGVKLPEKIKKRPVPFSELCLDAKKYTQANNEGHESDTYRIDTLKKEFGERNAEMILISEFRRFFDNQTWKPGTYNRCRTVLFAIYRLGIENGKVTVNPARLLKRRKVSDDRVRFLNQFPPLATKIEYLKALQGALESEEGRLRAVIENDYPEHIDEFVIALNTGMRRKEMYVRIDWTSVDLVRKDLSVPQSKNGEGRHIPLNTDARLAFERLRTRKIGEDVIPIHMAGPIFVGRAGEPLLSARHWFEDAVSKAGIKDFTWHDLRHTFASRLVMAGVDITTVASLMGHKKIQMTMRYAHLAPAHKLDAVERLCAQPNGASNAEAANTSQK
jgi:integrase